LLQHANAATYCRQCHPIPLLHFFQRSGMDDAQSIWHRSDSW
jgi:hypothetical protein